jgi:hypothetical protein
MVALIVKKLDTFIRKYYRNRLIKGVLYSVFLLLSFFLLLTSLEFFGYNSILVRSILFYSYCVGAIVVIYFFIALPLLKLCRLTKTISYKEAAKIIGEHFPEVKDKLLNLLQLNEIADSQTSSLIQASIEQKTQQLSPIPFVKAIDLSKNKKYAKLVSLPVGIIILIGIFSPSFLTQSTLRYIKHNTYFAPAAPFSFNLLNKDLRLLQNTDVTIRVCLQGKVLVDQVDIVVDNQTFAMRQESKNIFSFTLNNVQKSQRFYFSSSKVQSQEYVLQVVPKPVLLDLEAIITPPAYTRQKPQTMTNVSNFSVPKGATVIWRAKTRDTKKFIFATQNHTEIFSPDKNGLLTFAKRIMGDIKYQIYTKNNYTLYGDSLQFQITSIADVAPQIAVIQQQDSLFKERVYFRGQIKDDYGFSRLEFRVERINEQKREKTIIRIPIKFNTSEQAQEFYYYYDLATLNLKEGERITYYFQVWDNDAVDGVQSARSTTFTFENPTLQEINKQEEMQSIQIKKQSAQSLLQIEELKKQIEELKKQLLEKKDVDWQDKKQLDALKNKEEQIKKSLEEIHNKIEQNNALNDHYKQQDDQLSKKAQELEKLFKELEDSMIKDLDKLLKDNVKKEDIKQALDNIKQNNSNLEKQLDRNLEIYKRLEVEKKFNETIDKLNQLSQDQKQLAKQTEQKQQSQDQLQKKQSELTNQFNQVKKDINDLKDKASKLEDKQEIRQDKQKEQQISQNQQQAQQNIQKNNNKQASKQQQQAAQKMEEMSQQMQQQQEQQQEQQEAEDAQKVRQILKNLVTISKTQESLMSQTHSTTVTDPRYQKIIASQNEIKDNMKMIEDTLFAMSKRQPQIGNVVNRELTNINSQIESAMDELLRYNQGIYGSYRNSSAKTRQQYAMSSMNNLALMLAESLNNMEQSMNSRSKQKNSGKPKSSCSNPGSQGKKQSMQSMRQMQQELNKEIQRLQKELEKQQQQNPNGRRKIGESVGLNEKLTKSAAQQQMIRKMMQEYANEVKEQTGKPSKDLNNLMNQMEQNETDIVNKKINSQTLQRQNEILTRMLESEKAQKTQDKAQKRESKTGNNIFDDTDAQMKQFNKLKQRELELFKEIPPVFSPYYKRKVSDFFINLNADKRRKI